MNTIKQSRMRLMLGILALCLLTTISHGKILTLQCTIDQPSPLSGQYNVAQAIRLGATWDTSQATPPYAVTFKVNGTDAGTTFSTSGSAQFSIGANTLVEGPNNFGVSVVESSQPGAALVTATALGSLIMDKTGPSLALTLVSGSVVSPVPGFNEVTFVFSSSEALAAAPTFTTSPGTSWGAPVALVPETAPFISNQYKLTVPAGTPGGTYTITATGKDNTHPTGSENIGTKQISFTVLGAANGGPVINSSSPNTPCRLEFVQLTGTVPAETKDQKVEVLEGASVVATTNVAANITAWNVFITNLAVGSHTYTARRTDPLGNVSALSNSFVVVADRAAPGVPQLSQSKTPVNTATTTIIGSGSTDASKSAPVKITLYRNGTQVALVNAADDGSFTFNNVAMIAGANIFTAKAADTTFDSSSSSGNQSESSEQMKVVLDQGAPVVVGGGVVIGRPGSTGKAITSLSMDVPDAQPQPPTGFVPPAGANSRGPATMVFPVNLLKDRFSDRIKVTLLVSDPAGGGEKMMPMKRGAGAFSVALPAEKGAIGYRFMLKDPAGNVSYFPPKGQFQKQGKRVPLLRLPQEASEPGKQVQGADEWPVNLLGLPPADRLVTYRQILVPSQLIPTMKQNLAKAGYDGIVEVGDVAGGGSHPTFHYDLDLLRENRLPKERVDLLLGEIQSEIVPLRALPDFQSLPNNPAYKPLKDAIQFRTLHQKP